MMVLDTGGAKLDEEGTIAIFGLDAIGRFATLVAAAEREACAKVCEDDALSSQYGERSKYRQLLAAAIRARGQA